MKLNEEKVNFNRAHPVFKFSNIPCFKLVTTFSNFEKEPSKFSQFTFSLFNFISKISHPNKYLPSITNLNYIRTKERKKKKKITKEFQSVKIYILHSNFLIQNIYLNRLKFFDVNNLRFASIPFLIQ